jgi:hypothetical protein
MDPMDAATRRVHAMASSINCTCCANDIDTPQTYKQKPSCQRIRTSCSCHQKKSPPHTLRHMRLPRCSQRIQDIRRVPGQR